MSDEQIRDGADDETNFGPRPLPHAASLLQMMASAAAADGGRRAAGAGRSPNGIAGRAPMRSGTWDPIRRARAWLGDTWSDLRADAAGAGVDLATRFQPVDDLLIKMGDGPATAARPAPPPPPPAPAADPSDMTLEQLQQILPRAGGQARRFLPVLNRAFRKYGITTPAQKAAFLAQVSVETRDLNAMREGMNYSRAERIRGNWPRRFPTLASTLPYTHSPEKLGDYAYDGYGGNLPGSGDGYRYRGGGLMHITGRDAYRAAGHEDDPESIVEPQAASDSGLGWWATQKLDRRTVNPLNRAEFDAVVSTVNKARRGEKERWAAYQRALRAFAPSRLMLKGGTD